MKLAVLAVLAALCSAPAWAQENGKFRMEMVGFEDKAEQVVVVNLEGESLDEGRKLLAIRENVSKSFIKVLGGLKGIYRRTYRFGRDTPPEQEDVTRLRERIERDGWAAVIDVQDRNTNEAVTVYSLVEREEQSAVTVVSSDSGEVTVINIVGQFELGDLADIGEQIGVPSMRLATTEIGKEEVALPEPTKSPNEVR